MSDPLSEQIGGDHYKGFAIQPVEFIHANSIPFLEACAIKYLCRHRKKGGRQDLEKARHYIDLLVRMEYPETEQAAQPARAEMDSHIAASWLAAHDAPRGAPGQSPKVSEEDRSA